MEGMTKRTATPPRFFSRVSALVGVMALLGVMATAGAAAEGDLTLESVDSSENQGIGSSIYPSISSDGRFVAFWSYATNLVANDTNDSSDIFVHDRQTGTTERVSVNDSGNQANDSNSLPTISPDGRLVAFVSYATNLVADDTNGVQDVFVHDRQTGTTERVSVNGREKQTNGGSHGVSTSISPDGRFVAFASGATNLVKNDTNKSRDIFVRDRQRGTTERVSVDGSGNQANDGCRHASISSDGRFVAFGCDATNLVANDTNERKDVFVHERWTGSTRRVSVDSSGNQLSRRSIDPSISSDGSVVAFVSNRVRLRPDIFVRDRHVGTTQRVSENSSGKPGNDQSFTPAISSDGRFVTFESRATNLVTNDTNGTWDIFVYERESAAP